MKYLRQLIEISMLFLLLFSVTVSAYYGEYTIVSKSSGKMLYVSGESGSITSDGANVKQHNATGENRDIWIVRTLDGTNFRIMNKETGNALVPDESSTNIYQWSNIIDYFQEWKITEVESGYVTIESRLNNTVATVEDGHSNVFQEAYSGSDNQKWKLEAVPHNKWDKAYIQGSATEGDFVEMYPFGIDTWRITIDVSGQDNPQFNLFRFDNGSVYYGDNNNDRFANLSADPIQLPPGEIFIITYNSTTQEYYSEPKPPNTPPYFPGNFRIENVTKNAIAVSWFESTGADYYTVAYNSTSGEEYTEVITTETSFTFSDLDENTTRRVTVRAHNEFGTTGYASLLTATTLSTTNYSFFFGDIHNHSTFSDGIGDPNEAYRYAREDAELDFFGLSDHENKLTNSEWDLLGTYADTHNKDGEFVALRGFEWTSKYHGHVTVIATEEICYSGDKDSDTFSELLEWLDDTDGIAFLNHPGREGRKEFNRLATEPSNKVVGMELFNKGDNFNNGPNGKDGYYYNNGYYADDADKSYFDEANTMGWKLGAYGGGDHHGYHWGDSTDYRVAVLALSNTREHILAAFRDRRMYSTLDKNLQLSFELDDYPMGSTISAGFYPLSIRVEDPNNEIFTKVVLIQDGIQINEWSINDVSVTINEQILVTAGSNYYVKITQADGDEAISSPIFIEAGIKKAYIAITSSTDDAEEYEDHSMHLTSSDLELVEDKDSQIVGLRFKDIPVPKGAIISNAYIQFRADETNGRDTYLTITGHDTDNSSTFTSTSRNISDRKETSAQVDWRPNDWTVKGEYGLDQRTPDISSILQEITDRSGWSKYNRLSLFISGSGKRVADSYDAHKKSYESNTAPILVIEYQP